MAELFNNSTVKLTTVSTTSIYQAPNNAPTDRSVIISCLVANVTTVDTDVTVSVTDAADVELVTIAHTVTVPRDASIELIANRIVLKQGQKIRAAASAANSLDVMLSCLEVV